MQINIYDIPQKIIEFKSHLIKHFTNNFYGEVQNYIKERLFLKIQGTWELLLGQMWICVFYLQSKPISHLISPFVHSSSFIPNYYLLHSLRVVTTKRRCCNWDAAHSPCNLSPTVHSILSKWVPNDFLVLLILQPQKHTHFAPSSFLFCLFLPVPLLNIPI